MNLPSSENNLFYHGSRLNNLTSFPSDYAKCTAAFGPVIYLTKDFDVAECYGDVYLVELNGPWEKTINYNESTRNQSDYVRVAITSLFKNYKEEVNYDSQVRWEIERLNQKFGSKTILNCLSLLKIWMVYGSLSGMEMSGLMDRGIQFGVICPKHTAIKSLVTRSDVMFRYN